MSEVKFTNGEWHTKEGASIHGVKSVSVYYPHGFLTSANVIEVDETRMSGESWIDMRKRTEVARKAAAIESNANMYLIAAAPEMYAMLEEVAKELYNLIDEVNDQRLSHVNVSSLTQPDLCDGETIHRMQLLLAKARGE